MATCSPVHPEATGLSALRVLKNGKGRFYTAVEGSHRLIEQTFRHARAFGFVEDFDGDDKGYAILDVLDDTDAIVQDYEWPEEFVEAEPGDEGAEFIEGAGTLTLDITEGPEMHAGDDVALVVRVLTTVDA